MKVSEPDTILVKDSNGHMYRKDKNGMVMRVSVEEGIEIERNLNDFPKPYIDFLERVKSEN